MGRLVVLGSNTTLTAKVISWQSVMHMCFLAFFTPVLTQLTFKSHRLLFSHALAEVRGEDRPERKFASTGSQTHNHLVKSPTRTPLSHPGGHCLLHKDFLKNLVTVFHGISGTTLAYPGDLFVPTGHCYSQINSNFQHPLTRQNF